MFCRTLIDGDKMIQRCVSHTVITGHIQYSGVLYSAKVSIIISLYLASKEPGYLVKWSLALVLQLLNECFPNIDL